MTGDRQLLLELGGRASLDDADLIVTPANAEIARLIDAWPEWSAPLAVIIGPPGSGKTHFATVWQSKSGARALADPRAPLPADLRAAEAGQPVLCDGLSPEALDETALFHLINAVRSGDGTMLLTTHSAPAQWSLRTPDLASRLRAATVAHLQMPDDALVRAVAIKLFADRQVTIDPAVIDYMVPRIERSLATLGRIVDRLDRAALARQSRITKPMVAAVLDEAGTGNLDD